MHALKKLLTFWQRYANLMVSYCFSVIFTGGHAVKNKKTDKNSVQKCNDPDDFRQFHCSGNFA